MELPEEVQKKIRLFSDQCLKIEESRAKPPLSSVDIEEYNRSLEETVRNLQDRVQQQQAALQNVCLISSRVFP
jgi:hypothetical protein